MKHKTVDSWADLAALVPEYNEGHSKYIFRGEDQDYRQLIPKAGRVDSSARKKTF